MKTLRFILVFLFIGSICFANTAPTITKVTAIQRTDGSGVVDISYTLADADNDKCTVTVLVSNDGGNTWTITPTSFTADSKLANVGNGRWKISWNSKVDLPGVFGSNYQVKVTANDGKTPEGMVYIPAGTFQMGNSFSGEGYSDQRPIHYVTLSSFYMCDYLITNIQYCNYLSSAFASNLIYVSGGIVKGSGNNLAYFYTSNYTNTQQSQISFINQTFNVKTKSGKSMDEYPLGFVSWYGAVAYCNWRSQQEGKQPCYNLSTWNCDFSKNGYRLPTEAEWEYAARGGLSGNRFPWGNTITHSQANYYSSSEYSYDISPTKGYHPIWNDGVVPYLSPVGNFAPNNYGLYDMAGNVWEWCNDWYSDSYYSSSPVDNPTGPTMGTYRVMRGGNWYEKAGGIYSCRVDSRCYTWADNHFFHISGFRIVIAR